MIRFTSGSVFKAISLCKTGRKFSDDAIADMLFPQIYTSSYIAHVKDCTKNLPDEIFQYMKDNNQTDIATTLLYNTKEVFEKVIKKEMQTFLIACIQQILQDDSEIADTAQIGYDPIFTKRTMTSITSLDPIDFIANTLYGICGQQTNTEGKAGIKELDKAYIANLKSKADNITFIHNQKPSIENGSNCLKPTYDGDDYQIIYETPGGEHDVVIYERFNHSWSIKNTGIVTWVKRLIVLMNKDTTRVKPVESPVRIPDLKPGEQATVTATLDARYFEGKHELIWDIQTEDGVSCYPNKSGIIRFEVTVKNNLK